jgi:hypothetical protein
MPSDSEIIDLLKKYWALKLGESPWPTYNPNEGERHRVDWESLFPGLRGRRQLEEQRIWDIQDDRWNPEWEREFVSALQNDLNREEPTDSELEEIGKTMLWDVCAWYQPIHFCAEHWGIYIREDCILRQARLICRFIPWPARRRGSLTGLAKCLIRASVYAFFLHEHYHHKIESLGLRLHVVDRKSCYLPYHAKVYSATKGTDAQLEEALANADSYYRLDTEPYKSWITYDVVAATWQYLEKRFPYDPPGYRMAINYLSKSAFDAGEDLLHGQMHEATVTPLQPHNEWNVATRLTQSLFKVTDNIWVIVGPRGRSVLPTRGRV